MFRGRVRVWSIGSLGRVIGDSVEFGKALATGDGVPELRKIPMLRKVYGSVGDNDRQRAFYDRFDEMLRVNQAISETPSSERVGVYEAIGPRKDMVAATKLAKKQLSRLSKARSQAEAVGDKDLTKKIQERRMEVMNAYVKRYNKLVHGM